MNLSTTYKGLIMKNEINSNCWIQTNQTRALLLFNVVTKEAQVDDIDNPTSIITDADKNQVSIKKANILEIVSLKYGIILLLIYLSFNINLGYSSMLGLGTASLIYLVAVALKKFVGKTALYLFSAVITVVVIYLTWVIFEINVKYNIGFIINYMIQYLVSFFIFHMIITDIFNEGYRNYYKATNRWFRWLKISKTKEAFSKVNKNVKKANIIFFISISLIGMYSLFVGSVDIYQMQTREIQIKQKIKEYKKKEEKRKLSKQYQKLNQRLKDLGVKKGVHHKIKGVQGYDIIRITPETRIELINKNHKKIKSLVFNEKETRKLAYIYENRWIYFHNSKRYRVMSTKAR